MLRIYYPTLAGLTVATLLAAGTGVGAAVAREQMPARHDNIAMGEEQVKKLLPLMEQDKEGRISKQAFMKYMEAEFERLDKDKSGQLDGRELTQPQVRSNSFTAVGK